MNRFKVGDMVIIVRVVNPHARYLVGGVFTIIRESSKAYLGRWIIDECNPLTGNSWNVYEEHMKHIYDGNEKTSWSDCVWKPTEVTA